MSEFPFNGFPIIVQMDIVKKMYLREIFERTLSMPELKNIVKMVKPVATKLKWQIHGEGSRAWFKIILYTDVYICPSYGKHFEFWFGGPNNIPDDVPRHEIDGVIMPIQYYKGYYKILCGRDDFFNKRIQAMGLFTRHLMDIFKIESFHLNTDHAKFVYLRLSESFIFKITRKFSDIEISGTSHWSRKSHEENAKFLLEDIQVDNMKFYVELREGIVDGLLLKHKVIHFGKANWLPFSSLFNMQCQEVLVEWSFYQLKSEDLLTFIANWSEGKLENLKVLCIKTFISYIYGQRWNNFVTNIFSALEAMKLVVGNEENSRIIERNDGKKATLILNNGVTRFLVA